MHFAELLLKKKKKKKKKKKMLYSDERLNQFIYDHNYNYVSCGL